jgi:imidazolonepropionase-like amidohydrolase
VGLPAAAHVHGQDAIADAVEAGFDTIEHVTFMTADGVHADPAVLERIARSGVVVSATMATRHSDELARGPMGRRLPAVRANLERLHRAGARIVASSDAGIAPVKPHDVLPYGIVQLAGMGMTNREALRAGTALAAEACGVGDRKGRLRAGHDADLLAVSGDPLTTLSAIHDVLAVFRAGRRVR